MSILLGNKGNQNCNGDLDITHGTGQESGTYICCGTLESVPILLYGVLILACFPAKDQKAKLPGLQNW